jgi:hypothetical protein
LFLSSLLLSCPSFSCRHSLFFSSLKFMAKFSLSFYFSCVTHTQTWKIHKQKKVIGWLIEILTGCTKSVS